MIDFGGDAEARFRKCPPEIQRDASPVLEFVSSGFSVTWFADAGPRIWLALIKPHANISDYFAMKLEYLVIGHGFDTDFQQRTLLRDAPAEITYRIDTRIRFIASAAPNMKQACALWAIRQRTAIVPVPTAHLPSESDATGALYRMLAEALWRRDIFDDSEPVTDPTEFFGREQSVQELVGRVSLGQSAAVFGLRKIGKTSLLRRVRDLLQADANSVHVTAFIQCNATKFKGGRWHAVVKELIGAWAQAINRSAEDAGLKTEARPEKLRLLFQGGRPTPTDGQVAEAFERDFHKVLKAAQSIGCAAGHGSIRLIAMFDEADELYPTRPDAGYWKGDYFALWNTLQTLKRGLDDPDELLFFLGGVNPAGVESGALLDRPNPLFELSKLYLRPLSPEDSSALMSGLGSRIGLSFEAQALKRCYAITGGHPWLLRKLGSQIHKADATPAVRRIVTEPDVERVFERTKRAFYQHVEWILQHLKSVAPDEYRLLKDIAQGGAVRYLSDWADEEFRDTFAEHLSQYGIVTFQGELPFITVGLISDALRAPSPSEFVDQKARIRDAADLLEGTIRMRLLTDVGSGRTAEEAIEYVIDSIPREAANRASTREQLRAIGAEGGMQALLESLNWGDYVLLLLKPESGISWSGNDFPIESRREALQRTIAVLHLARHNNDASLRKHIQTRGYGEIMRDVSASLEMLAAV